MKTAFIIPVYKHGITLESVISSLIEYNLPVIVVDDGNDEENKRLIQSAADNLKDKIQIFLIHNEKNLGKGGSVKAGVFKAKELGFTHVFQIDSDGQHDCRSVRKFLEAAEKNPDCVIAGCPEYDETVPKSRRNGRKIANFCIHTVTLSKKIVDGMIGFRIYPVESIFRILKRFSLLDLRMGFDIEILARLCWAGLDIISLPVKISYPMDGISNFHIFKDNARISWVYTRLHLTMFLLWPLILWKNHKCKKMRQKKQGVQ